MGQDLNAQMWQEDLTCLTEGLRQHHANLYHSIAREQFDEAVTSLAVRIPHFQRHEIIVEMARIVAMIGDGHTSFRLDGNTSVRFHRVPLRFYEFSDGIVVQETDAAHQTYLGLRLVRIGDYSIEEALTLIQQIVSADNDVMRRQKAVAVLHIPEILHALKIIPQLEGKFTLQNEAGEPVVICPPMSQTVDTPFTLDTIDGQTPLWRKHPEKFYWFEYLDSQKLVYVMHRVVRDMDDETMAMFCDRLFAFLETHPVERLVIDLRQNGGGNNQLNQVLVHGLIRNRTVNHWGRLFTLVGRRTFSAAMNLAVDLETHTRTLFVGEPTGASPNHYGDNFHLKLPHSGVELTISELYWQSSVPYDKRPWITPHLSVAMSSAEYRQGIDRALEQCAVYEPDAALDFEISWRTLR